MGHYYIDWVAWKKERKQLIEQYKLYELIYNDLPDQSSQSLPTVSKNAKQKSSGLEWYNWYFRTYGLADFMTKHGTWAEWDADGNPLKIITYNKGIPEGKMILWYPNQNKAQEGEWHLAEKAQPYDSPVFQGFWKIWYKNGQLYEQGRYDNGKKVGEWVTYHPNGQLREIATYLDAEKHGAASHFRSNGTITSIEYFEHGIEHGPQTHWYENGALELAAFYFKGMPVEKWRRWHDNQNLETEGVYRHGYRDQKWTEWFRDKTKKSEYSYFDGYLHGPLSQFDQESKVENTDEVFFGRRKSQQPIPDKLNADVILESISTAWIEIFLKNSADCPSEGTNFKVTDPLGKVFISKTNEFGIGYLENVSQGMCDVEFLDFPVQEAD